MQRSHPIQAGNVRRAARSTSPCNTVARPITELMHVAIAVIAAIVFKKTSSSEVFFRAIHPRPLWSVRRFLHRSNPTAGSPDFKNLGRKYGKQLKGHRR